LGNKLRFCSFVIRGEPRESQRAGIVVESKVFETEGRWTMHQLLGSGEGLSKARMVGRGYELDSVELAAPVPRPGKILATIVNTQAMLGGKDVRLDRPRLDMKAPSAVIGPGETILAPSAGIRPEVELGAVIGKRVTRATPEQAEGCIAGFTIVNDVTAPSDSKDDAYEAYRRDRATGRIAKASMRGPLFRSKNHDTFCPMGPWVVTPEEIRDVSKLKMTTRFDDLLVQEGNTSEYLFGPARIASYISEFLTLEPGDIVSCGSVGWTPAVLGTLDPTEFVLPAKGGSLELEIEGVGRLANPVSMNSARE
jgi:2-keto-4-pentenoate hydratase/2-oxohepta-3-ene-1,7-dioic acid hydratase in catechol pathway